MLSGSIDVLAVVRDAKRRSESRREWMARQARLSEQSALDEFGKAVEEPEKLEVAELYGEVLERALAKRKAVYAWQKRYRLALEQGRVGRLVAEFEGGALI